MFSMRKAVYCGLWVIHYIYSHTFPFVKAPSSKIICFVNWVQHGFDVFIGDSWRILQNSGSVDGRVEEKLKAGCFDAEIHDVVSANIRPSIVNDDNIISFKIDEYFSYWFWSRGPESASLDGITFSYSGFKAATNSLKTSAPTMQNEIPVRKKNSASFELMSWTLSADKFWLEHSVAAVIFVDTIVDDESLGRFKKFLFSSGVAERQVALLWAASRSCD